MATDEDDMHAEVVPSEKVELVIATAMFGGSATDERMSMPIVMVDAITVYDETFEACSSDELQELANAEIAGTLNDPRVMRRRLAIPLHAVTPWVRMLRDAERVAHERAPGGADGG